MREFKEISFGTLRARYSAGTSPSAPLYVFVHGRAGNFQVMAPFARGLPEEAHILLPQAPLQDQERDGFSWWQLGDLDFKKSAETQAARFLSWLAEVEESLGITPEARFGVGFSQGGALLSVVMQKDPALFGKVVLLASFVIEQPETPFVAKPAVLIGHGRDDEVVSLARAESGVSFLRKNGFTVEFTVDSCGHKVGAQTLAALKQVLN